jgi:SAM-dependent methyltransferase
MDNHPPFLDRLSEAVTHRGLGDRITVLNRDMFTLNFDPETFDVIWAEGSIYIMGFENALRSWRPLLKKPGYLAATEITWLRPDPPDELRSFWAQEYPGIQDVASNLRVLRETGYSPIGHFTLPESDWWAHYYTPVERKLPALREKYKVNSEALGVLELEAREIDLYRRFCEYYGYVFYVARAES